jgi:hypothetical protein
MRDGVISPKAGERLKRRLKLAAAISKDEGGVRQRGEIPGNQLNHPTNQAGGRVSKTGGAGPERQEYSGHINDKRNAKRWIPGSNVSRSNPATGNTRMRGKIAPRGGPYGGGGRGTQ